MDDIHPGYLIGLLIFLLLCSAFFSSSETGILSLNRYRLRHLAKEGHSGAKRVTTLLSRPDRLLGTILIGNNFVNILASAIATVLASQLWGDAGIAIATVGLTLLLLIFGGGYNGGSFGLQVGRLGIATADVKTNDAALGERATQGNFSKVSAGFIRDFALREHVTLSELQTGVADKVVVLDPGDTVDADLCHAIAVRVDTRIISGVMRAQTG